MSDHVEILYEEGPCLVVLKPSGILTQAPPGIDSMEVRLKSFLSERDNKPGNIYLGVPHRLDRPVSGAMLFARHVRACRRLSEQFFG
ncbi:MAG: pseudouridine synthase, partial [Planctomycetota bacterium]|nr:pseudouridine synthase [Planctomycetota bacterium]